MCARGIAKRQAKTDRQDKFAVAHIVSKLWLRPGPSRPSASGLEHRLRISGFQDPANVLQPPEDEDAEVWPDFIAPDDDEDMGPEDDEGVRPLDFMPPEDDVTLTPVESFGL
jgi:hypothetical protein